MASGNTTTSTDTNLSLFHTSASTPHVSPNPLRGRVDSTVLELLDQLHERSIAQEGAIDPAEVERVGFDDFMRDKFIALDQDKCWFAFQMCLAAGARNVVEAGTSFGVSTIYLALALRTLASTQSSPSTIKVIATENEPTKAAIARCNWAQAGVSDLIDLREGDLRETLARDMPIVDVLLLDIWAPHALPALKLTEPHLRPGSLILLDNSTSSAKRYAELLEYLRAEDNGYAGMTVPFSKGLEVCVYLGKGH